MKIKFLSNYWNGIQAGEEFTESEFIDVFGYKAFNLILCNLDCATDEERERGYMDISDIFHIRVYF